MNNIYAAAFCQAGAALTPPIGMAELVRRRTERDRDRRTALRQYSTPHCFRSGRRSSP